MGKRSRQKGQSRLGTSSTRVAPDPPPKQGEAFSPRRLSGWRLGVVRVILLVGVPSLLLVLLELGLRVCGYGFSTSFFEQAADGQSLTTNPQFAWQFYSPETATAPSPLLVKPAKPPGTLRIVILGESAAAGTPDPAFGFARILELMLQREYPDKRFEVVNAAMRGINSHIVLPIARECAQLAPDLYVVYMGNNELIGFHSPSPGAANLTPYLGLLRLSDALRATRTGQWVQSIIRRSSSATPMDRQNMAYLRTQRLSFDDPARTGVYDNFRTNIRDIIKTARRSGARAVVATVASNVRDFPPLGSLHRRDLSPSQQAEWEKAYAAGAAAEASGKPDEALAHFQAAEKIDDHFAELHFRLARLHEAAGRAESATRHYQLSRDWDALQFRTDSRLNEIVRQTATEAGHPDLGFVDVEKVFAESPLATNGTPGNRLFHDHVHFTFDGDYLVAKALLPQIATSLGLPSALNSLPTRDESARALAYTPLDELNVIAAMVQQASRPPFLDQLEHDSRQRTAEKTLSEQRAKLTAADFERIAAVYQEAIALRPDDWMLHYNHGNMLGQFNQYPAAVGEYEYVVKRLPRHRGFRTTLGNALLNSGRKMEAIAHFHAALQVDPKFTPAREGIAAAQRSRR